MSLEMCFECDDATGNAGELDGSLMLDGNPYCDECYQDVLIQTCDSRGVEVKRLTTENLLLRQGVSAVSVLIGDSYGVTGLHLNGDYTPWDDLLGGGRFEGWLHPFSVALELTIPQDNGSDETNCPESCEGGRHYYVPRGFRGDHPKYTECESCKSRNGLLAAPQDNGSDV